MKSNLDKLEEQMKPSERYLAKIVKETILKDWEKHRKKLDGICTGDVVKNLIIFKTEELRDWLNRFEKLLQSPQEISGSYLVGNSKPAGDDVCECGHEKFWHQTPKGNCEKYEKFFYCECKKFKPKGEDKK